MKAIKLFFTMLAAIALTACSDSDDEPTNTNIEIAGTYLGWTNATSQYFPEGMTADNQSLTVVAENGGTYKLTYTSSTWGDFTFTGLEAVTAGNSCRLSGDGTCLMGMNGSQSQYACHLEATIDAEKKAPAFTITVPAVMGGLTITFATGDMPEQD